MNPNLIIIGVFIIAGLITTVWGWTIISRGRRTLRWPSVDGVIEQSTAASDSDDLWPQIVFSYTVSGQTHRCAVEYPSGTTPTPEFAASYVQKFPVSAPVKVFYNPAHPEHATLEPGLARGDWMIFVLGLLATIFGGGFLLVGGQ